MSPDDDQRSAVSNIALLTILGLFVGLPAVAFLVGFDNDSLVFFLYREPKLVAVMILGWLFVASASWILGRRVGLPSLRAVLRLPPVMWLSAFLAYLVLSLSWTVVKENARYELQQYFLLFLLLIFLLGWDRIDVRVQRVVRVMMVLSIAVVTFIGLFQASGLLAVLKPIDPSDLVGHPSLMGYKNPMAMAMLGQFFILAGFTTTSTAKRNWKMTAPLAVLLILELVYLITLQSRAALFGLAIGLICLFALSFAGGKPKRRLLIGLSVLLGFSAIVALVATVDQRVNRKVRSAVSFILEPGSFLESDRGIYLINTLNMVHHNPLGVGIGDWQTHYPVYRVKERYVWFDEENQVRRAHSDHVQFLGEVGWPGFFIWVGFLLALIVHASLKWVRGRSSLHLYATVQLIALCAAMAVDYVVEHPYGKFQFFLVVFLCLSRGVAPRQPISNKVTPKVFRIAFATLLTVIAVINTFYFVQLARKLVMSAHLTRTYLQAVPSQMITHKRKQRRPKTVDPQKLRKALDMAETLDRLPGHTKTTYRDHLLIADACRRLGWTRSAQKHLDHSLSLHPHHPPSLRLMSLLITDPNASQEWMLSYEYVMHEATDGFQKAYPPGHPLHESDMVGK